MARVLQISKDHPWPEILGELIPDDVLLLAPGYYELPKRGFSAVNVTIKGLGTTPEDTTLVGFCQLEADCSFFTMENLCLETKTKNNAIYISQDANTYLTLRRVVVKAGVDDTAAIAASGQCTLEIYDSRILGGSLSLFPGADYRVTLANTEVRYDSDQYAAVGIQGHGTVVLINARVIGMVATYAQSDCELDINDSRVLRMILRGKTWLNLLQSTVTARDDNCFYATENSWLNIVASRLQGTFYLGGKTRTLVQNTEIERLLCGEEALATLSSSQISAVCELHDSTSCRLNRVKLVGKPEFEYFLLLADHAKLTGKDLVLDDGGRPLGVHDEAQLDADVLTSQSELEVETSPLAQFNLRGVNWHKK